MTFAPARGRNAACASALLALSASVALGACDVISGFDDLAFDLPPPGGGGAGGEGGSSGPCVTGDDCASGFCADGVCCDEACDGPCAACDLAGSEGVCTQHAAATNPEPGCEGTCDGAGTCATGDVVWSRQIGGAGADTVNAVALDSTGRILLVGGFDGSVDFGDATYDGENDAYVLSLDAQGDTIWSLPISANTEIVLRDVAVDADDNIIVGGYFNGVIDLGGEVLTANGQFDVLVFKLAPDGTVLLTKQFGDPSAQAVFGVAVDADQNIVFGGYFAGNLDFGSGNLPRFGGLDAYVAKLDPAGNHLWSRSAGSAGNDTISALAIVGNSDEAVLHLAGSFESAIDFGSGTLNGVESRDGIVVQLDELGTASWQVGLLGTAEQHATAVAPSVDGILVGGVMESDALLVDTPLTSAGAFDVWAARLDDNGAVKWAARFGTAANDGLGDLTGDGAGNLILTGAFVDGIDFGGEMLAGAGGDDVFVAKIARGGEHLWSQRFGFANDQRGRALAVDTSDAIRVAGEFKDSIRFAEQHTSAGETDIFVVKLAP